MNDRSIAAVTGLRETSEGFRRALLGIAQRNTWNVDALAAVMSLESGFHADAKNPNGSAVGILQFIEPTLRGLGFKGTRDDFGKLSAEQQLVFVERFYERAEKGGRLARPVDYYVAAWGAAPGLPDEHVLAAKDGDEQSARLYRLNAQLDRNSDGFIRVGDLRDAVDARLATANGVRLVVSRGSNAALAVGAGFLLYKGLKWLTRKRSSGVARG